MLAVITADTREPLFEIAAIQELVDDLRDDRAQDAVAGLVAFLVDIKERIEMPRQARSKPQVSSARDGSFPSFSLTSSRSPSLHAFVSRY